MQDIIKALNWRYATKAFDPAKKVSESDFETIIESMRLSASSYGLQPWKFIVVSNPEVRAKIRAAAWDQTQVTDASHLVVLTVRNDVNEAFVDKYIQSISEVRGVPVASLQGYSDMMKGALKSRTPEKVQIWASRQVYIPLGTALLTAATMKIDACPMEGFDNDKVDEILGLDRLGVWSIAILTVGYRSADDKTAEYKKVRYAKEEVVVTI
jgi:nitroreductase